MKALTHLTHTLSSVFVIPLIALLVRLPLASAATVSDYDFIVSEIQKSEPLAYAEVREMFRDEPQLNYTCFIDEDQQMENEPEAYQLFGRYIGFARMGTLTTAISDFSLGFNVVVSKREVDIPNDTLPIEASLACATSEEPGTCGSLKMASEKTFLLEQAGDSLSPEGNRKETWDIYVSNGAMYANRSIDFEATKLNWIGNSKGTITLSLRQVCHLQK